MTIDRLNQLPYYFYFLVVDEFLDISQPALTNFTSISPQKLGISLTEKNSGRLLSHPRCQQYITEHTPSGLTPAIIPFKPSPKVELICRQRRWLNISNPAQINRLLEDKIKFLQVALDCHLPLLPYRVCNLSIDNYRQCQKEFGKDLVVQTHFGWAGNSSHLSHCWEDISSQIEPNVLVKITPYLQGVSLINNCCLTPLGLLQSPPGLQYTGIPQFTHNPLATVGRQWPAHVKPEIAQQVSHLTSIFSTYLQTQNYRGFFGIDFFVHQDKVFVLECNARLTASFAFYTALEEKAGINPLFHYHLLSFSDPNFAFDLTQESLRSQANLVGSEITKKDSQGKTVAKFNDFVDLTASNSLSQISL